VPDRGQRPDAHRNGDDAADCCPIHGTDACYRAIRATYANSSEATVTNYCVPYTRCDCDPAPHFLANSKPDAAAPRHRLGRKD
jgi:hypothetical protein